jgi:cytochrome c biogenesis protein CcdA
MATVRKPVWRVAQFMVGVFAVNFAAGVILTIGPGRLLLGLVPHPQGTVRHVIELVAGLVLLGRGGGSVGRAAELDAPRAPDAQHGGGSALIAGALAAVELPTAAPYFAGIVAANASLAQEIR